MLRTILGALVMTEEKDKHCAFTQNKRMKLLKVITEGREFIETYYMLPLSIFSEF